MNRRLKLALRVLRFLAYLCGAWLIASWIIIDWVPALLLGLLFSVTIIKTGCIVGQSLLTGLRKLLQWVSAE